MTALLSLLILSAAPSFPAPGNADVRIVLVRHGQAFSNLDNPPALPPDQLDALTDLGKEQIKAAADQLKSVGVCRIISSPAGRAQQSAALLAHILGIDKASVDARLEPMKMGAGEDGGELPFSVRVDAWKAGKDPRPKSGESMEDVGKRVLFAARAPVSGKCRTIAFVAHSEVIAAFLGEAAGVAPASRYPWKIPNASLSIVDVGSKSAKVLATGLTPEAGDAGVTR